MTKNLIKLRNNIIMNCPIYSYETMEAFAYTRYDLDREYFSKKNELGEPIYELLEEPVYKQGIFVGAPFIVTMRIKKKRSPKLVDILNRIIDGDNTALVDLRNYERDLELVPFERRINILAKTAGFIPDITIRTKKKVLEDLRTSIDEYKDNSDYDFDKLNSYYKEALLITGLEKVSVKEKKHELLYASSK